MKILVVDSEADLAATLGILQQAPGNEIISARTGDEALEITQGHEIDLLITEVFIEPMNGFTLRNKMENRHAGVRTIFQSGYDLTPYAEHTVGSEVITKPAAPYKIFPAIARAMGGGGPHKPEPEARPEPQPQPEPAPAAAEPEPAPVEAEAPVEEPQPVPEPAATQMPLPSPEFAPAPAVAVQARSMPVKAATPKPAPIATAARPAAVAAPKATPAAKPARTITVSLDPLVGKTLGNYLIEQRLGKGKWGPVYLAIQTSMNRPVAMELLAQELAGEEAARQNFIATARAKATVQHPHILSVYEADQAEGHYFYTHEYVDGSTVAQLAAKGEGLSDQLAVQTLKCVAQGLAHLEQQKIAHSIPDATDIYIGSDGLSYLSNVAQPGKEMPSVQEEICALGEVIRSVLPGGFAQEQGLRAMLTRMGITNQMGFQSWPSLFQAIQAIEPKVVPVDAFRLSAQDAAAIQAVEAARKRQRMTVIGAIAGLIIFIAVMGGLVWWEFLRPLSHDYTAELVKIDGGDFIYQEGQHLTLPTYYIDKYEVTIAEYGKFLKYLADHGNPTDYDDPLQPPGLSHVPRDWDTYYGRAGAAFTKWRTWKGVPITLDCPVFNVSYFDAYAYAKWIGHRLPTQQEWEKAARGASGNLYPWGNTWDPKRLNAGDDFQANPDPGYKPEVDGYTWWAPVDALMTDRSPYGVIGMAGNVSEWTDSWDSSKTQVIIRGGNYKSTSQGCLTTAQIKTDPNYSAETLGFRTVSDTPPAK